MKLNESKIDITKHWYFGNNRSKKLKMSPPAWNAPFFTTTDYSYAKEYADYGVYELKLNKAAATTKILDFSNSNEVKKLNWPKVLTMQVLSGRSDLNAIAFDMYNLVNNPADVPLYIDDTVEWQDAAERFEDKCDNQSWPFTNKRSHWEDDSDNKFVLRMWADIYEAGFDGFTYTEFNHQVLALFTVKMIDEITFSRIDMNEAEVMNEGRKEFILKNSNERDVDSLVRKFWAIKSRLPAPKNDIDWWIKQPFSEFKQFVISFEPKNKNTRRDDDIRKEAVEHGATYLGDIGEYEVWHPATYEANKLLGRNYKHRPTHWCISSDDPEYWFDNYSMCEFVFLIRKNPKGDEKDKIAIEFMDGGRYFNVDEIEIWDLNDQTSADTNEIIVHDDVLHEVWEMFATEGCKRTDRY